MCAVKDLMKTNYKDETKFLLGDVRHLSKPILLRFFVNSLFLINYLYQCCDNLGIHVHTHAHVS